MLRSATLSGMRTPFHFVTWLPCHNLTPLVKPVDDINTTSSYSGPVVNPTTLDQPGVSVENVPPSPPPAVETVVRQFSRVSKPLARFQAG